MLSGHVRAWGRYHSRILDRWAANLGRSEGAIAEEAVPFPGAVRRSLVVLRCARPIYAAGFSAVVPAHAGRLLERRDHVAPTLTRAIASMTSVSPSGANKRMSPSAGQAPSLGSKQLARQSRMWVCPAWHSSTGRARRAILITALCAAAPLAHAQQLPSIESLKESYVACVQSAFVRRLDDFAVNGKPATSGRARVSRLPDRGKCPLHNCGSLRARACSGDRPDPCRGRTTQGQPEGRNAGTATGDAPKI
jgi:hypothetical protein